MDQIQANGEWWITRTAAAEVIGVHPSYLTRCMAASIFCGVREMKFGKNKLINKSDFEEAASKYEKRNAWSETREEDKNHDLSFAESLKIRMPMQDELLEAIRSVDVDYLRQWRESRGQQDEH